MNRQIPQKGFTLVELLVAVGIIGILATVSTVAIQNIRTKARDAKRIQDVRTLAAALDQYADSNATFVLEGCTQGVRTTQCVIPADFPLQNFTQIQDPLGTTACGRGVAIPCQFSIGSLTATTEYEICFGLERGDPSIGAAGLYRITPGRQILSSCSYQAQ